MKLKSALHACAALALALPMLAAAQAPVPAPNAQQPDDPRVNLTPGLFNAGETSMGLEHLGFVKKPDAFRIDTTDENDPSVTKALSTLGVPAGTKMPPGMKLVYAGLAFANSDFAFEGNTLIQGNFYGANFYDISNPAKPALLSSLICPGGQGDVSVYGHLLFYSVEMPNGRIDCGTQAFPPPPPPAAGHEHERPMPAANPDRFRGVRIFDITDVKNPKQVAAVQTCRGSHTHTLVTDPTDPSVVYIYVSGTSFVRSKEELAGCSGETPDKDPNTSLFSIDVIKVPLAHPEEAKIVSSPRIFIDPHTSAINGLFNAGDHDKKDAPAAATNQCHDITVYGALNLAAGACSGNGILLDISDRAHPKRIDAVNDPNYSYWHSASFSNDGTKVVFTDEWGGGMGARCRKTDPMNWGADAIFSLKDNKLSLDSYYKMPAPQGDSKNCVAHNGSLIPIPGRDIEVQAWYQGGISVMDFTDPAHPYEIAYFDRGAVDPKTLVLGGYWSGYWYNGAIYGSEIARGLDSFKLTPTKFLTQHEIDAANLIHFQTLNVQDQQKIVWPQNFTVARAYLDQLARSQALPADKIAAINEAIDKAEKSHSKPKEIAKLHKESMSLADDASGAKTPADAARLKSLAAILGQSGAALQ
jgi:hypothetical protein